ncbi:hypothetical protein G6L37_03590 [Agrobacterium rubi]|nr:hypothetical protein [Agrobacterium rubi]NTF24448.1 hypothetical protein [Agrobacterium rubi]
MREVRKVTAEEFAAHIEEMKRVTGHDGSAPKSRQPKIDVRELVASL